MSSIQGYSIILASKTNEFKGWMNGRSNFWYTKIMKLLFLADLHLGKSRESSTHPGIIRQASTQASEKLVELVTFFNSQQFDLIFQMGDIVRETGDKNLDNPCYLEAFSVLTRFKNPLINLLGNHELNTYTYKELKSIYNQSHLNDNFFGSKTINDFQLIWLDHQTNPQGKQYLSEERLEWLKTIMDSERKIILLSHYSIIPQNMQGNFLFESKPDETFYSNSREILSLLNDKNVILALSAHSHWIGYKKINAINYLSIPSFSENIAAEKYPENNPAIYTTIEALDNTLFIKSFSGDYCFFNLEL